MRLPLWIGMVSFVGLLSLAGTTFGQVDPGAKKALEETAEAVKNLGPCTFTIKMNTEGLGSFVYESEMKVKLIRDNKTPSGHSYQILGDFKSPGGKEGDSKVNAAMIEGKTGEWIDDAAKTLFIRPIRGVKSDVLSKVQTPSKAFEGVFLEANPFKAEIESPLLTMEKAETVNGEECQVIKAVLQGGSATRLIYISALDKLPRKYEQRMGKEQPGVKQQIRRYEVKDLNTEVKLTVADMHLKAPEGYKTDKVDAPAPAAAAPAAPAAPKLVPNGKGMTDEERLKEKQRQKEEQIEKQKGKDKGNEDLGPDMQPGKPGVK